MNINEHGKVSWFNFWQIMTETPLIGHHHGTVMQIILMIRRLLGSSKYDGNQNCHTKASSEQTWQLLTDGMTYALRCFRQVHPGICLEGLKKTTKPSFSTAHLQALRFEINPDVQEACPFMFRLEIYQTHFH